MTTLTEDTVLKIAKLARLAIEKEQVSALTHDLSRILGLMEVLTKVDVSGVSPTVHCREMSPVTRPDEINHSVTAKEVTSNAPAAEFNCFLVPKVIE